MQPMKILIRLIVSMIAVFSMQHVFADFDGNWWNKRSEVEKMFYMFGMVDGTDTAKWILQLQYWAAADPHQLPTPSKENQAAFNELNHADLRLFGNVSAKQLTEGLNHFYSDFRNRKIDTSYALYVVGLQIAGTSDEAVRRIIELGRKVASETDALISEQEQDKARQKAREGKP